jgi:hypothetical protein
LAGTLFARLEPSPLPPGLIPSAKRAKPARLWQTPCISKARTERYYALYVVRSTPKITVSRQLQAVDCDVDGGIVMKEIAVGPKLGANFLWT